MNSPNNIKALIGCVKSDRVKKVNMDKECN